MTREPWTPSDGIRRDLRLIDQSITSFSILRDRYRRRSLYLSVTLLVAGVALVLLTFGSDEVLALIGVQPSSANVMIGVAGAVLFVASLIELRVDWQGQASLFGWASDRFAEVKLAYRTYLDGPKSDEVREAELRGQYQTASALAPRIPEAEFLPLKQAHLRKVALSKMVSRSPGTPILLLRWRLMRSGRFEE